MPVIARIDDQTHSSYGYWFLMIRQGSGQVAGNMLDGQGPADPEGKVISEALLGDRFNCPEARLDRPSNTFHAFPVRVYGKKTPSNPAGEYEIATLTSVATPASPTSVMKPRVPSQFPMTPTTGSTTPRGTGNVGGTGTAVMDPPVTAPPVVKKAAPKQRLKPQEFTSPSVSGLSLSGKNDGAPVIYVDRIATYLDLLPVQQPIMIWGPAGIGKSEVIGQYAMERGLKLYDFRLSMMDPTTIGGVGVPDLQASRTRFLPIDLIPDQPGCILVLDEITTAPPTIQALAYQITWDRRIGSVALPEDCRVICAGNRVTDRGVAYTMPSPLANRLFHLTVKEDLGAWKKWAFSRGIDARIISFLVSRFEFLHKMDPAQSGSAWPSPRSWSNVDRVLKSNLSPVDQGIGIAGCVGVLAATEFIRHCDNFGRNTKRLEDILNGFAQNYEELDPSKAQTLGVAVVANATDDPTVLENVISWAKRQNKEYGNPILAGLKERFGEEVLMEIPAYSGITPEDATKTDDELPF